MLKKTAQCTFKVRNLNMKLVLELNIIVIFKCLDYICFILNIVEKFGGS